MTIASNTARESYACDGSTTVFAVNIQAYLATDFLVILTNTTTGGGINLVLNSDYTLVSSSTLAPPFWTLTTQTGQIVSPYISSYTLQVILNPTEVQQSQYVQGQAFPSLAIQTNLDRLTQMAIRSSDQIARTIRQPDSDVTPWPALPAASVRANTNMGFDINGLPALNLQLASGILSQSSIGQFLYPQTPAEAAAGVTPTNYAYSPLNALRYGADPTGVADSTTAINNAIAVARVGGGLVYLPGGTYKTSATLAVGDYSGVWLTGDGVGITIIQPTSALGSNPVLSFGTSTGAVNQGFGSLSIICANATSCTAVSVFQANGFWATNFLIQQANIGILVTGGVIQFYDNWQINRTVQYGIQVVGGNDQYFNNGVMSNVGYIQAAVGINVQSSGGAWLSNLDIISQGINLLLDPSTNQVVDWLFAVNCAFDTASQAGVLIQPSNNGAVNGCDFTACWSSSAGGPGFTLGGTTSGTNPNSPTVGINGVRLTGVRVFNNQGHGIVLSANNLINTSILNCDIAGNSAPISTWSSSTQYSLGNNVVLSGTYYTATTASLNQSPPNAAYWSVLSYAVSHGIYVVPNVGSVSVNGNRIGVEAGQVNTQGYAVIVSAGSSNNYSIVGNDVRGNLNTPLISDAGTGTTKIVHSNLGQSPPGSTAITVTASPFSYANNTGAPIAVIISGGTVSSVTIETQGTGNVNAGQFTVPQGASITVTYSVAPAMVTYGLM